MWRCIILAGMERVSKRDKRKVEAVRHKEGRRCDWYYNKSGTPDFSRCSKCCEKPFCPAVKMETEGSMYIHKIEAERVRIMELEKEIISIKAKYFQAINKLNKINAILEG